MSLAYAIPLFVGFAALAVSLHGQYHLWRERTRVRVLTAFIAGLIVQHMDKGGSYADILADVKQQFELDYLWGDAWKSFMRLGYRYLFDEKAVGKDGFNMMYWDFFDWLLVDSLLLDEATRAKWPEAYQGHLALLEKRATQILAHRSEENLLIKGNLRDPSGQWYGHFCASRAWAEMNRKEGKGHE
jgi:hypothetical protein